MDVSPIAVISIMALHFSNSSKWPDPFKDDVTYVVNPIESGFPGHWLPLSIIKKIMEMRVLTLASEASTHKNDMLKLRATTKTVKYRKTSKQVVSTKVKQNKPTTASPYSNSEVESSGNIDETTNKGVAATETFITTPLLTTEYVKHTVLTSPLSIPTNATREVLTTSSVAEGTSDLTQTPTEISNLPTLTEITEPITDPPTKITTLTETPTATKPPTTTITKPSTTTTTKPPTTTTTTTAKPPTTTSTSTTKPPPPTTTTPSTTTTTEATTSRTTTSTTETGDPFY